MVILLTLSCMYEAISVDPKTSITPPFSATVIENRTCTALGNSFVAARIRGLCVVAHIATPLEAQNSVQSSPLASALRHLDMPIFFT